MTVTAAQVFRDFNTDGVPASGAHNVDKTEVIALFAQYDATIAALSGSTFRYSPQGRLTLSSGAPVMTSDQASKTSIFYTPYVGDQIPLYNGTILTAATFAELTGSTTDTTKNPSAIGASKVNDWFVWNDAGTLRLSHGPDWTSDTARSAGTALVRQNGTLVNSVSITNGPAASRGTYVGTTKSDASSQLNFTFGGAAAGGTPALFNVWNMYNRVDAAGSVKDTTDSWTYAVATWRQARAVTTMRVDFVCGQQEDMFESEYVGCLSSGTANNNGYVGIGIDSTTAFAGTTGSSGLTTGIGGISARYKTGGLGAHSLNALEFATSGITITFFGDAGLPTTLATGLWFKGRF